MVISNECATVCTSGNEWEMENKWANDWNRDKLNEKYRGKNSSSDSNNNNSVRALTKTQPNEQTNGKERKKRRQQQQHTVIPRAEPSKAKQYSQAFVLSAREANAMSEWVSEWVCIFYIWYVRTVPHHVVLYSSSLAWHIHTLCIKYTRFAVDDDVVVVAAAVVSMRVCWMGFYMFCTLTTLLWLLCCYSCCCCCRFFRVSFSSFLYMLQRQAGRQALSRSPSVYIYEHPC